MSTRRPFREFKRKVLFYLARLLFDLWKAPSSSSRRVVGKKILFLHHYNMIGDAVVSTCVYRVLKENDYTIGVLSGRQNYSVIANNESIDNIVLAAKGWLGWLRDALKLRRLEYDIVVDIVDADTRPRHLVFFRLLGVRNIICFNRNHANIFNHNIEYRDRKSHFTNRYRVLLDLLGVSDELSPYEISFPSAVSERVDTFLYEKNIREFAVINPYGSSKNRRLTIEQVRQLCEKLKALNESCSIFIIGKKTEIGTMEESIIDVEYFPFCDLSSAMYLVKRAKMVVSTDTSIIHVAAAFRKNTIGLYGNRMPRGFINNSVWAPNNNNAVQIIAPNNIDDVAAIDMDQVLEVLSERYEKRTSDNKRESEIGTGFVV